MLLTRSLAAAALSLAMRAPLARAATMDVFTFTSPVITGPLTTTLPASPTPDSFVPNTSFTITGTVTFEGNTLSGPITFLNSGGASGGGVTFTGPVLFSGPDANPTFNLGTFTLSGNADIGNGGVQPITGTLVISQSSTTPPVPEPNSIALVGTGALGLAGYLRRRYRTVRHSEV